MDRFGGVLQSCHAAPSGERGPADAGQFDVGSFNHLFGCCGAYRACNSLDHFDFLH
jgi:hypothetical protein